MRNLIWILLVVLAIVWAISAGTGPTLNFTSGYILGNGILMGILGLLIATLYAQKNRGALTVVHFFMALAGTMTVFSIIFFLSVLLGDSTGFWFLTNALTWICDKALMIALTAALLANAAVFVVLWFGGLFTTAYYATVTRVVGFSALAICIILGFMYFSSGTGFHLPKGTNPLEEKASESRRVSDSVATVKKITEQQTRIEKEIVQVKKSGKVSASDIAKIKEMISLMKELDKNGSHAAEIAKLERLIELTESLDANKEIADNSAGIDQGDPIIPSNEQEIVDEDGTQLINKDGKQAIRHHIQPD
ncbi:MAG: hypothetical protein WCG20_03950 [bacterium]